MGRPTDTRSRIICAAEDVVIRDGVAKLTLEAAAHEAGVSKGGVLYHFPSRAALVAAMVERFVVSFDADLVRRGSEGGCPGDFVRAYIDATVAPSVEAGDPREQHLGAALLAGAASDPVLLEPLRARFATWQSSVEADGIDRALATIVRLACDGIWLSELFGLAPADGRLRSEIGEELRSLVLAFRSPEAKAGNGSSTVRANRQAARRPSDAGRRPSDAGRRPSEEPKATTPQRRTRAKP